MGYTITCKASELHEHTDGLDLDSDWAEGFTVGRGKIMYWYFIWHSTGNATVYTPEMPPKSRFISGDQLITIHFKYNEHDDTIQHIQKRLY